MSASAHPRYAIYFAPATGSRWWQFGSEWLGRDAATGAELPPLGLPGFVPQRVGEITRTPRHYGFHATLKAPFTLAPGRTKEELCLTLAEFARAQRSFDLGEIRLDLFDDFLVLRPVDTPAEVARLERGCVERFDEFRAPLTGEELAHRRRAGLSVAQESLLERWGYPFVLEEFRFHLTLTGALTPLDSARLGACLAPIVAALNSQPLRVDALCLFEQPTPDAPFRLIRRFGFDGSITDYSRSSAGTRGKLYYVVGPSGAGKDSLMRYARDRLNGTRPVIFAHRYITRAVRAGDENHIALTGAEFAVLHAHGAFALAWESHGHRYGIGAEINAWMANGLDVVVNGSREYLPKAIGRYPDMTVVWVNAPIETLERRLAGRGRENDEAVRARLQRAPVYRPVNGERVIEILNDAELERAGNRFVEVLTA